MKSPITDAEYLKCNVVKIEEDVKDKKKREIVALWKKVSESR